MIKISEVVLIKQCQGVGGTVFCQLVCVDETSGNGWGSLGVRSRYPFDLGAGDRFPMSPKCFQCKMKCTVKLSPHYFLLKSGSMEIRYILYTIELFTKKVLFFYLVSFFGTLHNGLTKEKNKKQTGSLR